MQKEIHQLLEPRYFAARLTSDDKLNGHRGCMTGGWDIEIGTGKLRERDPRARAEGRRLTASYPGGPRMMGERWKTAEVALMDGLDGWIKFMKQVYERERECTLALRTLYERSKRPQYDMNVEMHSVII